MDGATKWAIAHGMEIEITQHGEQICVSLAFVKGDAAYVMVERVYRSAIQTELDRVIVSLVQQISKIAGIPLYCVSDLGELDFRSN